MTKRCKIGSKMTIEQARDLFKPSKKDLDLRLRNLLESDPTKRDLYDTLLLEKRKHALRGHVSIEEKYRIYDVVVNTGTQEPRRYGLNILQRAQMMLKFINAGSPTRGAKND